MIFKNEKYDIKYQCIIIVMLNNKLIIIVMLNYLFMYILL